MTPLQQACLNKLRATADANAAFFEINMPMHKRLLGDVVNATIDVSEQGELTIRYVNGESKSLTLDILEMEDRLVRFADITDRPQMLAFHQLRAVVSQPSYGEMNRYHYSVLDLEFANRVRWHFAKHYPDNAGLTRYPEFGDKHIPLAIVFGSGLGWHLPRLLVEYKIRHLMVIDTDVDAFRLSAFFQDYVLLSRLAAERGTDLTFIVQPDVEQVSNFLMYSMRKSKGLPPFFIHGAALFYAEDESVKVDAIKASITETLWELFFGLGYFDDELISIKHTFDNLRQGFPIYMKPNIVPEDAVAFIVGSGPSLDDLIPILQEYGDRAVIFSCGTALAVLEKMGIRPDFHVEKERPYVVFDVLVKTVDREFLKSIHFIGLNVVHSDVFNLFKSGGVIMKTADTMGLLLTQQGIPQNVILSGQPTVTNLAIDFALSAGFRQVYLFGVDMGCKDKKQHHSRHAVYHSDQSDDDEFAQLLLSMEPVSDIVVPGNFGGEVSTDKILFMARKMMGSVICLHPEAHVFNLNDGAMIKGAIPLRKENIELKQVAENKMLVVEAILGAFENRQFVQSELEQSLLAQVKKFTEDIAEIIAQEQRTRSDVIDKLSTIYDYIQAGTNVFSPCALLFRGVIFKLLSMTFNAVTIIKDEDEMLAKAEWDFANMLDFLEQAKVEVEKHIPESPVSSSAGM